MNKFLKQMIFKKYIFDASNTSSQLQKDFASNAEKIIFLFITTVNLFGVEICATEMRQASQI
jgi:hypothetical protein